MDTIVVNDTNIFIDLYSIDLLNEFFDLPLQIHTTDFVINELKQEDQREKVLRFHEAQQLFIKTHTSKEIAEIMAFLKERGGNVSITDCSVWLYAQQNNYHLITGDNKLCKSARASGANVSGILHVFDLLIEHHVITPENGSRKLSELLALNCRLPRRDISERLELWSSIH